MIMAADLLLIVVPLVLSQREVLDIAGFVITTSQQKRELQEARAALERQARQMELTSRELAEANARLQETSGALERHAAQLSLIAEISRRLSTILDQKQLVTAVVDQVRLAFDYYHVHLFLFDDEHTMLQLAGATGDAGQSMLAAGYSLPKGKGVVGRAAETNAVILVGDVSQTIGWIPNPLMPDVRAEAAVPISLGDRVLGVLHVMHSVAGGLKQEDADLLQALANQVAIALQNARLYEQAQQQAEREALINRISQSIQSAGSVPSALQVAVRELGQALGGATARVRLKTSSGDGEGVALSK